MEENASTFHDARSTVPLKLIFPISFVAAILYFFSNPKLQNFYDYTFRVAENMLRGSIGITEKPPGWLNEFVPLDGVFYSVFPLGSVVTMMPFAAMKIAGWMNEMPGAWLVALIVAVSSVFLLLIARAYGVSRVRAVLMTLGILFGTWMWTNLTMSGAWQLALGFAVVGELGAIYFTLIDRRPFVAGIFFALAFGNRSEVLLTAPLFFYFLWREIKPIPQEQNAAAVMELDQLEPEPATQAAAGKRLMAVARFCVVPFILGVATLVYNYVRFNSFTDFGYSRIPGVLSEPWYDHGIFSPYYIPRQIWEMLFKNWEFRSYFPLPMPNPFSTSILISSPFLLYAFRRGARDGVIKYASWAAVLALCILLWMHGNSGGWQFAYRYAMVCLPWLFLIMLESAPSKVKRFELVAYIFSFIANAYATWLFHWTEQLRP